jgi:protein STE50
LIFLFLLFNVFQPVPELIRSPFALIRSPTDPEQLRAPYPTPSETPAPSLVDSSDSNNTKVGLEDPTSKVLPAALRKNKINEEEWGDYAMFITYGPPGNGILLES